MEFDGPQTGYRIGNCLHCFSTNSMELQVELVYREDLYKMVRVFLYLSTISDNADPKYPTRSPPGGG